MKEQPCLTCGIPFGASLKALREERDRLIPFVVQHRPKREEFQKWEKNLNERATKIGESEEDLCRRALKLAQDEAALAELMDDAKRPEKEIELLQSQNQELCQKMDAHAEENRIAAEQSAVLLESLRQKNTAEKKKRKDAEKEATEARSEFSNLTASYHELSRELDSLRARYTRESKLLESARDEVASLKKEKKALSHENRNLIVNKKELLGKIANSDRKISSLSNTVENNKAEIKRLNEVIASLHPASFSLSDIDTLYALSKQVAELFYPPSEVISIGSGPFPEGDFDNYLEALGITPYADGFPWIIVGREGWTMQKLERLGQLIDDADLDEVRVFSQELFIAGILTTHDPFSLPQEILMKFAEGHPALEYLVDSHFAWPEILIEEDYGEPVYLRGSWERVEESPLYRMGYQVGITHGQPRTTRRTLLKNAYQGKIPDVEDDDYMEEWGCPRHSKRLWRIAHHIAWLIRSRKSIPSMCYAVKDWQDDLDWMEEKFYTNRMRFRWPQG